MTGLPSSIVKKYGIGKTAWAVYRRSHSGGHRAARGTPMKRRTKRIYAGVRRSARRVHRVVTAGVASLLDIGFGFGYGYARSWIVNNSLFQSIANAIPFGGAYKDNMILGGLAYAISWIMRPTNPYIKAALRTIVLNEAFIAGVKAASGASLTDGSSGATSSYAGVVLN